MYIVVTCTRFIHVLSGSCKCLIAVICTFYAENKWITLAFGNCTFKLQALAGNFKHSSKYYEKTGKQNSCLSVLPVYRLCLSLQKQYLPSVISEAFVPPFYSELAITIILESICKQRFYEDKKFRSDFTKLIQPTNQGLLSSISGSMTLPAYRLFCFDHSLH